MTSTGTRWPDVGEDFAVDSEPVVETEGNVVFDTEQVENLSGVEIREYLDPKPGKPRKWVMGKISLPPGWKITGFKISIKPVSEELIGRGSTPFDNPIGKLKAVCTNKLDKGKAAILGREICGGAVRVQPGSHYWVCTTCGLVHNDKPMSNAEADAGDAPETEVNEERHISKKTKALGPKIRLREKGILEKEYPTTDARLPSRKKKLQTDYIDRRVLVTAKEKLGRDFKQILCGQTKPLVGFKKDLVKGLQSYLPDLTYDTLNNSVNRLIKRYTVSRSPPKSGDAPKQNSRKPRCYSLDEDHFEIPTSLEDIRKAVFIEQQQRSLKPPREIIFEGTTAISRPPSAYLDAMIARHEAVTSEELRAKMAEDLSEFRTRNPLFSLSPVNSLVTDSQAYCAAA